MNEERPLSNLSAHEQALEIERVKGELWIEITRLNGLVSSQGEALRLQAFEYERRLAGLNHEAEQLKSMQARYVSNDVYDRDKRESENRLRKLEGLSENWAGRMWLPMLAVAGLAAGLTAVLVRTLFH
jgi:hypothetical protein